MTTAQTTEDPRASWEALGEEWETRSIEQSLSVINKRKEEQYIIVRFLNVCPTEWQAVNMSIVCDIINYYKIGFKHSTGNTVSNILLLASGVLAIQIRNQKNGNIS